MSIENLIVSGEYEEGWRPGHRRSAHDLLGLLSRDRRYWVGTCVDFARSVLNDQIYDRNQNSSGWSSDLQRLDHPLWRCRQYSHNTSLILCL